MGWTELPRVWNLRGTVCDHVTTAPVALLAYTLRVLLRYSTT